LIREDEGEISGYAYANLWKERSAYKNSAEISIYLKNGAQGTGRGSELLGRLLEEIRTTSLHALIAGITLPNDRSVNLFEKYGFRKIGQFNEVGFKNKRWLDVGYWELIV
jgi:phosphinothricin acetyltransferase